MLASRSRAVLERDRTAFLGDLDPAATALLLRQQEMWSTLQQVPLAGWRWQLVGLARAESVSWAADVVPSDPSAVVATVQLHYRIASADAGDVVRTRTFLSVQRAAGELVVATGPDDDPDPWDLDATSVGVGARSLVLVSRGPDSSTTPRASVSGPARGDQAVAGWVAEVDAAAARVDAVWGSGWSRRVVVEIPADISGFARLLGRAADDDAGLPALAAVTTGIGSSAERPSGGNRVVVNPAAFAGLTPAGRGVVLSHELTHVGTRTAPAQQSGNTPAWLNEGFADYVGYLSSGIALDSAAGELLAAVRSGGPPRDLPADSEFDLHTGGSPEAYESAWLACRMVAHRVGQAGLVAFYRAVAERGLAAGLRSSLSLTPKQFTAQWRGYLRSTLDDAATP